VPYWQQIIDANRDRFVTGDPDLLVPGQDLVVP
jgi:nucleoid-associated protein YgaU